MTLISRRCTADRAKKPAQFDNVDVDAQQEDVDVQDLQTDPTLLLMHVAGICGPLAENLARHSAFLIRPHLYSATFLMVFLAAHGAAQTRDSLKATDSALSSLVS